MLSVGFFGRFLLEKGIDDFAQIVNDANEYDLKYKFLIGGSQDIDNSSSILVSDIFKKYNNVNIYNSPDYRFFFKKIDILIFPSYREGHPLYLLKSMAFGVVPIIYPNPGLSVDVIDKYNGIVSK